MAGLAAGSASLRGDVRRWIAGVAVLLLCGMGAEALSAETLQERVVAEVAAIDAGTRSGMEPLMLGRLWAALAADYEEEAEFARSEDAYNRALKLVQADAKEYAIVLDNLGSLYEAERNLQAAEECRRRALALRVAAGDRLQIARGKEHLAEVLLGLRKFKDAQREASEAYDEMVAAKDPDAGDLVATLLTLTYASCMRQQCAQGVDYGTKAVTIAETRIAADSLQAGEAHMALGYAAWKAGRKDVPGEEMQQGVEILKRWMTPGHPYALGAMKQYRAYLVEVHRDADAAQVAEDESRLEMGRLKACVNCTVSVRGLVVQ